MSPCLKGIRNFLALDVGYARIGLARTLIDHSSQSFLSTSLTQPSQYAVREAVRQIIRMKPIRLTVPSHPLHQWKITPTHHSTPDQPNRPNKLVVETINKPPTLSSVVQQLQAISSRFEIDRLIVGMPARQSIDQANIGDDPQCAVIIRTMNAIKAHWEQSIMKSLNQSATLSILRMPTIVYIDETMSTVQAKQRLYARMNAKKQSNKSLDQSNHHTINWMPKQTSGEIDSEAAAIILERYLTDSSFAERFEIN